MFQCELLKRNLCATLNLGQILHNRLEEHGAGGSMENVLGQEAGSISKINFIIGLRKEYKIRDRVTEEIVEHFYNAFDGNDDGDGDDDDDTHKSTTKKNMRSCEMLSVYLSITFQKVIMANPRKIILYLCDCCSQDADVVHIDTFHCILNIGSSSGSRMTDLMRWIAICTNGRNNTTVLELNKSIVVDVLDFSPSLAIDFRDDVRKQLCSTSRLKLISDDEVRLEMLDPQWYKLMQ